MQNLFYEVGSLDKRCYEDFGLSEDLLMENAAIGLKNEINSHESAKTILIVCGIGNNGADGIALSRMLYADYEVFLCVPKEPKSHMAKLQLKRANLIGIKESKSFEMRDYDIVVDALFGSGLNKPLSKDMVEIIDKLNALKAYKISCDIPSGLDTNGNQNPIAFKANVTITMGGLKSSLFSDAAKDFTGKIKVANLGISREIYEKKSDMFVLEKEDLKLPHRTKQDTNKGSFGHCAVILGDKVGAATMTSLSAFSFGAGLVSIVTQKNIEIPYHIMQTSQIPTNITALALGMGMADALSDKHLTQIAKLGIPKVVDADIFYKDVVLEFLNSKNTVLTPHPKEFSSLLQIAGFGKYEVKEIQENKIQLAKDFSKKYPKVTLVLKGANTIISHESLLYINPFGNANLSKGGSGDVLCGLIVALLAQSYTAIDAAISGSLALSLASENFAGNSYALTPSKLIEEISSL